MVPDVSKHRVAFRYLHGLITFDDKGDKTNDRPVFLKTMEHSFGFSALDMEFFAYILVAVKFRFGVKKCCEF